MFVSMKWLARHVDLEGITPQELADNLTLSTCEVEGLEPFAPHLSKVTVGHVLEREQHPDADKLGVCKVDVGAGDPLQIVCGAPNVGPGQRVAVATVGTVLPGDFKIKKSKIRGVESVGMICSVRELDLGDEHDGIWELPDVDGAPAPIGAPLAEALDLTDWVIEIDNKSLTHRPDLWGHRGIAREVAAIFERDLKPLDLTLPEIGGGAPFPVAVEDAACSRYLGLAIDGAENGMAPDWMRSLLLAVGQRPIDLLVDLSNFVMLDLGQPNHAFDRGALAAGGIVVRKAAAGESITTLDGEDRSLEESDLLITSGGEAVALAGIMGGEGSKVQAGTGQLLLECATFDATTVRRTSSRLALRTDSSARFEKTLDPTLPEKAAAHFARLLHDLQPGVTFPLALSDVGEWSDPATSIHVRGDVVRRDLGVDLDDAGIEDILTRLELTPTAASGASTWRSPPREPPRTSRWSGISSRRSGGSTATAASRRRRWSPPSSRPPSTRAARSCAPSRTASAGQLASTRSSATRSSPTPPSRRPRVRMGPSWWPRTRWLRTRRGSAARCSRRCSRCSRRPAGSGPRCSSTRSARATGRRRPARTRAPRGASARARPRAAPPRRERPLRRRRAVPPARRRRRRHRGRGDPGAVLVPRCCAVRDQSPEEAAHGTLVRRRRPGGVRQRPRSRGASGLRSLRRAGLRRRRRGPRPRRAPRGSGFAARLQSAGEVPEREGRRGLRSARRAPRGRAPRCHRPGSEGRCGGHRALRRLPGRGSGEGRKSLAYHVTLQSANKTLTDKDAQKFLGRLERVLEQRGASLRK